MVPMQQSFLMGPMALLCLGMALCAQDPEPVGGVYFANGVKVGEVTSSSAIIWTRLTATPERNIEGIPWPDSADAVPAGRTLGDMQDSVMGVAGEVRVQWWPKGAAGVRSSSGWTAVDPRADFTHAFDLSDQLRSATAYEGQTCPFGRQLVLTPWKTMKMELSSSPWLTRLAQTFPSSPALV